MSNSVDSFPSAPPKYEDHFEDPQAQLLQRLSREADGLKTFSQSPEFTQNSLSFLGLTQAPKKEGSPAKVPSIPVPVIQLAPQFISDFAQFVQLRGGYVSRNWALLTKATEVSQALQKTDVYPELAGICDLAYAHLDKMQKLQQSSANFGKLRSAEQFLQNAPDGFWLLHHDEHGQNMVAIKRGGRIDEEYMDLHLTEYEFAAKYAPNKQLKQDEVRANMETFNASSDTFQKLSREEAERSLQHAPHGVFLVRFDPLLQRSVLSQKQGSRVVHEEIPFYLNKGEFDLRYPPMKQLFPLASLALPDLLDNIDECLGDNVHEIQIDKFFAAFFIKVKEFLLRDEYDEEHMEKLLSLAYQLTKLAKGNYDEEMSTLLHVRTCISACRSHDLAHRFVGRSDAETLLRQTTAGRLLYFDETIQQNVICHKKPHGFIHEVLNFMKHPVGEPESDFYTMGHLMAKHIENIGTNFLKPNRGTLLDWLYVISG